MVMDLAEDLTVNLDRKVRKATGDPVAEEVSADQAQAQDLVATAVPKPIRENMNLALLQDHGDLNPKNPLGKLMSGLKSDDRSKRGMLKRPCLKSSGLYISVLQDRSDREH